MYVTRKVKKKITKLIFYICYVDYELKITSRKVKRWKNLKEGRSSAVTKEYLKKLMDFVALWSLCLALPPLLPMTSIQPLTII